MTKVGIKEIATRAGVSIATVSHSFRNPGRVSEATRKKVLAAADALGYTPNNLAVSLRTSKSGNIVVIIPDITDSYNSGVIKGIEKIAHSRGYSVLLGDTHGSEQRAREYANMVSSRQADGIILMSHHLPFDLGKNKLTVEDLPPLVNGGEFTGNEDLPLVAIDDVQAAMDATMHLVGYGHKDIAVITGDINSTSSRDRLAGFRGAMAQAGLRVSERLIIYAKYTLEGGEAAARELLLLKSRPSAILCFSDEIAMGCMYALRQNGFVVPNDISIMGFDNIPYARYFAPPLTTIAQPAEDIGMTCASIVLDLIDGKQPEKKRHILPHELLVRESTRQID